MEIAISGSVSIKKIGDEIFIFDRSRSVIHSFNKVGVFILDLLLQKQTKVEIAEKMCQKFDVDSHRAANDLEEFVGLLYQKGILTEESTQVLDATAIDR